MSSVYRDYGQVKQVMKVKEEFDQHEETGTPVLAPPGVVLLATVCAASVKGQTKIKLTDSGMEVLAMSTQDFGLEDLNKTVACIGVQPNGTLLIMGTVKAAEASDSHTSLQTTILSQLIDDFQSSSEDESLFEQDAEEKVQGMPSPDLQEEVIVEAARALTIKCGASSITLSADGRVLIRGKFVTNSASQLNRITGGSVKIN